MSDKGVGRDASLEEIKEASNALMMHRFGDIGMNLADSEGRKIKGKPGEKLEEYYGMENDGEGEPDFREANIELKCKPLKTSYGDYFYPKEPLSVGMIDYKEVAETEHWRGIEKLKKKFLNLMIVWFENNVDNIDESRFLWWQLWSPSEEMEEEIQEEYETIRQQILNGEHLSQTEAGNDILQTCPKHNYDFENREEGSYVKNDGHPHIEKPERRAWRIPSRFLVRMLAESAGLELVERGRTVYVKKEALMEKAREKDEESPPLDKFI